MTKQELDERTATTAQLKTEDVTVFKVTQNDYLDGYGSHIGYFINRNRLDDIFTERCEIEEVTVKVLVGTALVIDEGPLGIITHLEG